MKLILTCAALFVAQQATAGVVIDIVESGGNVELTLSGSLDTGSFGSLLGTFPAYDGHLANGGNIAFTSNLVEAYSVDFSTWTVFGTGGFANWDISSGDAFAMYSDPAIGVPVGYVSGSALSSSATSLGNTFASLGFNVGTYVTTLTNGGVTETVTVNVGIPTPGVLGMFGIAGLVSVRRRR